jgi:hypothetical protein
MALWAGTMALWAGTMALWAGTMALWAGNMGAEAAGRRHEPPAHAVSRSWRGGPPLGAGRSATAQWALARRARRRRIVVSTAFGAPAGALVTWAASATIWASAPWAPVPGRHRDGAAGLVVVAAVAGAVLALAAVLAWPRGDPDRWARGAAGEVATAALLRALPHRRWCVLHDLRIPGSRANVDHLVIGPTGTWVVDTKAFRGQVRARRGRLVAGSAPVGTGPVKWEAEVVSRLLGTEARPIVAVHGAGLRRRGARCEGVRVVPASALLRRLRRGRWLRPCLSPAQVRALAGMAMERFG